MKIVVLWTDAVLFLVVAMCAWYVWKVRVTPHLRSTWHKAFTRPSGAASATVLALIVLIGVVDSFHFRARLPDSPADAPQYSPQTHSLLDLVLARQEAARETSYSAPLAYRSYEKSATIVDGKPVRLYPRLRFGGAHLTDPDHTWLADVLTRAFGGVCAGLLLAAVGAALAAAVRARLRASSLSAAWHEIATSPRTASVRATLWTLASLCVVFGPIVALAGHYHVFGTDRVGNDLFYVVFKSIRTALVIGTMTTIVTLPIAVGLGIVAGYTRGWIDEFVQYAYTVVNSIPYVLLIAAAVLILQIFIDNRPELFQTQAERTDARLFFLCVILGLLSWTELCRLIRGETMKLRELEYVQAAQAFGVSGWRIVTAHLLPNVMHLVLIYVVISFSSLVLAEAVLSYVGVGVDPAMQSFGTLINTARFELAREPSIWWTLATAFTFMFAMVLSANVFSDAVRDAFDPKAIRR